MSKKYQLYLLSDCWTMTRIAAIQRARWMCEVCHERMPTQVHHLTYRRLGHEAPGDLLAVCRRCHMKLHKIEQFANDNEPLAANDNQPVLFPEMLKKRES